MFRRRSLVLLLLLLVSSAGVALDAEPSWVTEGPSNSVVSQIAVDPNSPRTLYAIADARVCKTVDGGRHWNVLTSQYFSTALAVAVDPTRAGRVLVATNAGMYPSGGVFVSADGGASWEPGGLNVVDQVWIDPSRPNTIYADDNFGFSRTLDGGLTWDRLSLPQSTFTSSFAFAVGSDGTAYAWFGSGKLFRSLDRGESWAPTSSFPPPFLDLRRLPDGRQSGAIVADPATPTIWAMTGSGLFRSLDRGASWELRGGGSASSLAIDPTNSAGLYAGAVGGVWRTLDAGRTWQPPGVGPPFSDTASVLSLAVDPGNPTIVYAGTFNDSGDRSQGFFRSEDVGASWIQSNKGLPGVPVFALVADPASPTVVYAAARDAGTGGIYKTRDAGANWEKRGPADLPNVTALAIDPAAPAELYVGTGNCPFQFSWQCEGEVRKTTDGGASWSTLFKYGGVAALAVVPGDPTAVYLSAFCVNLDLGPCSPPVKSTDGGSTWQVFGHPSGIIEQFLFDPGVAGTAFVLSRSLCAACLPPSITTTVFKTTDGGESWSPASSGLPAIGVGLTVSVSKLLIDTKSPGTIYAATRTGLFRTINGGSSWSVTGLTLRVQDLAIDPRDLNVLYAATDGGGVFRSVDRGSTWQPINTGLPDLSVSVIVIDSAGTYLHATTSLGGVHDLQLLRRGNAVGGPHRTRAVKPRA